MSIKLVRVPANVADKWLAANRAKAALNPLLAKFEAMSPTGPYYAALNGTHFVEGHKLCQEGNRRFMYDPDGLPLQLKIDDLEGRLIQDQGVSADVYSAALWSDDAALLALMREDNLNSKVNRGETELNAFGLVHKNVQAACRRLWATRKNHFGKGSNERDC